MQVDTAPRECPIPMTGGRLVRQTTVFKSSAKTFQLRIDWIPVNSDAPWPRTSLATTCISPASCSINGRVGARAEPVSVEKMRRRPAAAPIQIVKLAARHLYIAFGWFHFFLYDGLPLACLLMKKRWAESA